MKIISILLIMVLAVMSCGCLGESDEGYSIDEVMFATAYDEYGESVSFDEVFTSASVAGIPAVDLEISKDLFIIEKDNYSQIYTFDVFLTMSNIVEAKLAKLEFEFSYPSGCSSGRWSFYPRPISGIKEKLAVEVMIPSGVTYQYTVKFVAVGSFDDLPGAYINIQYRVPDVEFGEREYTLLPTVDFTSVQLLVPRTAQPITTTDFYIDFNWRKGGKMYAGVVMVGTQPKFIRMLRNRIFYQLQLR